MDGSGMAIASPTCLNPTFVTTKRGKKINLFSADCRTADIFKVSQKIRLFDLLLC